MANFFACDDTYGNMQISCYDDQYIYTFDENQNFISARIRDELIDTYIFGQSGDLTSYDDLIERCVSSCLTAFDPASTEILLDKTEYETDITLLDRRGECLVNTGTIDMTNDGVLLYVGGTRNTYDEFINDDFIDYEEAIDTVITALFDYQDYLEKYGLPYDSGSDDSNTDLGDLIGFEAGESLIVPTPEFKLLFETENDIDILLCEKQKIDNQVLWVVQAKVDTSWGDMDPILNFTYEYHLDAISGDVVDIIVLASD